METGHPRESKQFGLASSEGLSLCDIMVKACCEKERSYRARKPEGEKGEGGCRAFITTLSQELPLGDQYSFL